ncbi:hypothetical protein CYMTET_21559 [Cymbomonas tetramitiformis]|uniref:Uncharacterized protein n=1 Tax=Cymbomonas tetramitiformis TaxID=36881 RepID=A0AAE0G2A0_9CHLO|nr:hypothetical protein CYMTET_21559 [Cymbomonas tetramitiformis]
MCGKRGGESSGDGESGTGYHQGSGGRVAGGVDTCRAPQSPGRTSPDSNLDFCDNPTRDLAERRPLTTGRGGMRHLVISFPAHVESLVAGAQGQTEAIRSITLGPLGRPFGTLGMFVGAGGVPAKAQLQCAGGAVTEALKWPGSSPISFTCGSNKAQMHIEE